MSSKTLLNALVLSVLLALTTAHFNPYENKNNLFGNCMSTTDKIFELINEPLTSLNPWLVDSADYKALLEAGCSDDRDDGSLCSDKPAIGSGFTQLKPDLFLGLTDRGPNQDCEDLFDLDPIKYSAAEGKEGKGFPVKDFAPSIVHVKPDPMTKTLKVIKGVPLLGTDGSPISGLPNTKFDDVPYAAGCVGSPLKLDHSGLDTEDIAVIPGTDYVAIVEEYSPSVVIANYKTGVITSRHVPKKLMSALRKASYPIVNDIPNVYTNRRKNRGFEAVVVDAKAKYVIAIVQSPMLGENDEKTIDNAIIRCAKFSISIIHGIPQLAYEMSFILEASSPAAYVRSDNAPKDMKYSAAQYDSPGKFVALERAKGQVKLFLVDFTKATNIDETEYASNLNLERKTNGKLLAKQVGVIPADKTLIWDSAPVVGGSIDFVGSSKMEGFAIDMKDHSKLWMIQDNDFGLEGNSNAMLHKISLGRAHSGATVCKSPKHPKAPMPMNTFPKGTVKLVRPSTYRVRNEPGGAAENLDVHEKLQRAYVANGDAKTVDMYDVSEKPANFMERYAPGDQFEPTSSSVCEKKGLVAVGLAHEDDKPGRIDILSTRLRLLRKISHHSCFLVDSVKWSDDCSFLVGACEGEGKEVVGGVIVIDFSGPKGKRLRSVNVADFKPFDSLVNFLDENGVRLIESRIPRKDFEPEYVAIAGNNAFVTLQEANAIAVVDLFEAKVTEIKPIGYIDRSRPKFGLDASDKDGKINIRNYQNVFGMPQPDAINPYVAGDGKTYLVFANEGDAKDDVEESRGEDILDPNELNRSAVPNLKRLVMSESLLGRLKFSSIYGYNKETNTQEKIFNFGSRSFSIMGLDGTIVFDSGEWFARIQERWFPKIFNSNGYDSDELEKSQEDLFDSRSDDKGMEPESVAVMSKDGKSFAFIGFERSSIIVVFDITDPTAPVFLDAVQNHPTDRPNGEVFANGEQGDLDPEGLYASSDLMKLYVSGSGSNTVTIYDIVM